MCGIAHGKCHECLLARVPAVAPCSKGRDRSHLYGSSRLGMARALTVVPQSVTLTGGLAATVYTFTRGEKSYELGNHLGNVLARTN